MNFFAKFVIILSLCTLPLHFSNAQDIEEKHENEKKIKPAVLPSRALNLLHPILENAKRIRYYKEFGKDTYFYEVKAIFKKEKLSIKFDQEGRLIDIEVLKKFENLPKEVQASVQQYLTVNFKKSRIKRTQVQYNKQAAGGLETKNDHAYLKEFINSDLKTFTLKYEIEAEVIDAKKESAFYEFLFDANGKLEVVKKIIERADDNILY